MKKFIFYFAVFMILNLFTFSNTFAYDAPKTNAYVEASVCKAINYEKYNELYMSICKKEVSIVESIDAVDNRVKPTDALNKSPDTVNRYTDIIVIIIAAAVIFFMFRFDFKSDRNL